MKKMKFASIGAVLAALALVACDAEQPPETAVSTAVAPQAASPGETISDVVRDALAEILLDTDPFSRAKRLGTLLPTLGPSSIPAVEQMVADNRFLLETAAALAAWGSLRALAVAVGWDAALWMPAALVVSELAGCRAADYYL